MIAYDVESEDFARQTVVSMYLPAAIHPIHGGNWRTMADHLIDGLRAEGWEIVKFTDGGAGDGC